MKRRRKKSLHDGWTAAKTELPSVNQVASDKDDKQDESKTRDAEFYEVVLPNGTEGKRK